LSPFHLQAGQLSGHWSSQSCNVSARPHSAQPTSSMPRHQPGCAAHQYDGQEAVQHAHLHTSMNQYGCMAMAGLWECRAGMQCCGRTARPARPVASRHHQPNLRPGAAAATPGVPPAYKRTARCCSQDALVQPVQAFTVPPALTVPLAVPAVPAPWEEGWSCGSSSAALRWRYGRSSSRQL